MIGCRNCSSADHCLTLNPDDERALREVEAETVAYLAAKRTGLLPRGESYLDGYQGALDRLDLHRILKVASKVEKHHGLPFPAYRISA